MAKKLRLTPSFFHILLSLVDGPKHGYGIMMEVRERTGGSVKLAPGSLYWALDRLESEDLIVVSAEVDGDDERRVNYELTDAGRDRLAEEAGKLADIVDLARGLKVI